MPCLLIYTFDADCCMIHILPSIICDIIFTTCVQVLYYYMHFFLSCTLTLVVCVSVSLILLLFVY